MADSLDDFFAKKDKKRNKDKGKAVLSAEALVRELEEGSKQLDYPVRKENKTSTAIELLGLDADDADWRDFEDVERRDYTGLKVKEMSLQDQNEEEMRRLSSEQTETLPESTPWKIKSDETSSVPAEQSSSSAKQKSSDAGNSESQSQNKSDDANKTVPGTNAPDQKTSEEAGKKGKDSSDSKEKKGDKQESAKQKYVPPGGRGLAAGEVNILEPIRLSKTKGSGAGPGASIPNIQNEQDFPSLG